jgi:EAL domain-containing protein (putative c-di-GMP-specific phosphodiesterase class I)
MAPDLGVPLFVNLHPDELAERWLVRPDDPIGFYPHPVFLEITETATFTHHQLCSSTLREVCERTGAQLVIDDFGAGHSNLQRLLDLEPTIVKLDLALVRGLHASPRKRAAIRYMTALCHELGARVVAEGIEVEEELEAVLSLDVDFVQGFLLARPANPPATVHWPPLRERVALAAPPPLPQGSAALANRKGRLLPPPRVHKAK